MILLFNCPVIIGQLTYVYNGDEYELSSNKTTLFSDVTFNQQLRSSRMLTAQIAQARLKSAELMGLYLIFNTSYAAEFKNSDLFSLFVKYYGDGFKANVSDLVAKKSTDDSDMRKVRFECHVKTYEITGITGSDLPDLKLLCEQNYKSSRDLFSADLFLQYCNVHPADQLRMTSGFLSRQNTPLPVMAKCFGVEPGIIFETSLFGATDNLIPLEYELQAEKEVANQFSERLILMDLMTVVPGIKNKDAFYSEFLNLLNKKDELWDDIVLFASKQTEINEPGDVFETLQRFPGALNLHLFSGSNSDLYNKAVWCFNNNKQDSALMWLRDAINFNGLTLEKISLTAAVYRLMEEYKKALIMTMLCTFYGIENTYVPGNLYVSLKALGYSKTEALKSYLLNEIKCDNWSRDVISNY